MRLVDFIRANRAFLAAGFLLTFGSAFGQTFFISVFAGDIREEFGLSHADWGQIYSAGTIASAIVMVWAGALTDRLRVRSLGAIVIVGLAMACLFMAWTPVWWALIPAIFLLRLTGQGMMSHLGAVSMARWFVATRGRALSIASLGFAAAEATLPILFVALLVWFDWRFLWLVAAGLALLLFPVLRRLLTLERTPQSMVEETQSDGMDGHSWTRRQMLKHPLFWLLVPTLLGPSAFNTAFFFQQVHIAEVKGWTHLELVALFPFYTATGVTFSFLSGFIIDKVGTARIVPLFQLPLAAAFLVFAFAQSPWAMLIGFLLMGITNGSNSTIGSALWAEFYGTRHIGAIKAMAAAVMVLGSAIGPGITGSLITAGIGIETQFVWIAGYFLFGCLSAGIGVAMVRNRLPAAA